MQTMLELICYSDHITLGTKLKIIEDLRPSCSKSDLAGVRIGIPWHLTELKCLHHAKLDAFKGFLKVLQHAGATLVHDVKISGAEAYERLSIREKQIILDTDMKIAIEDYLSSLSTKPNNIRSLKDLIHFTKSCPQEEFLQRNVEVLECGEAIDSENPLYREMLAKDAHFTGESGILGAMTRYRCDVLLLPTLSVTLQTFAAKAGSPVLSLPTGKYPPDTEVECDVKSRLVNVAPGIP